MVSFSVSLAISFIATLLLIRYQHVHAHITGDYDLNGVQKFHATPVPRIGGVSIMLGIISGAALKFVIDPNSAKLITLIIISTIPAFAFGMAEDITKRIGVRIRFISISISAAIAGIVLNAWLTRLNVPLIDEFLEVGIISVFVTLVAVTGVTNAFNIIDGYNGLSSMIAIMILLGLAYVAYGVGDVQVAIAAFISIGGILGFLLWNYPRGLIFLGDGGAYLIGFIIAELSVLIVARNATVSPWFPLLICFYPVFETIFTICRRIVIHKKNIGLPDAAHLHQLVYNNLVCWAVGSSCKKERTIRNSLTAPYLWGVGGLAILPGVIFWDDTTKLQIFMIIYSIFYIVCYVLLYNGISPAWLKIKR